MSKNENGWKDAYQVTGGFLLWLTLEKNPNIVKILHSAMKDESYNDSIFIIETGKDLPELWEAVIREYSRNKFSIEDAYHQARLARILREGEYNYQTNQPKLWDFQYEHYRNFRENKKAS